MCEPKSHELVKQYQAGRSEAAAAIFNRYVERLIALARARIGPKLKRRVDPEDVVQSAYRSFFVHAKNQEYQLARSGDLWRLLASTTLNKLYGQIEKQTAAKRSIDREVTEDLALANLTTRDPAVVEVVAVGEQLRLILDGLSPDERVVLISTLQGQSVEEIGSLIGKSARTVRRLLAQAKQQFEERLLGTGVRTKVRCATTRSPIVEPQAPLRFSDYVLEQLLGSGGMGKVYRATDKHSGKTVAVKALHKSRQSDERAVAQFVQESQILATLRHPNIVGVQGLGRFPGGGHFIVMDFVDGVDLQARLDTGPLAVAEAVSIVGHVAAAIQHAHDHGIVHCDLKPANVLVDKHDHVFVTDFGFAFLLAETSSTRMDGIGGTAGYIPPEILHFQRQPTRAADVFAMGVLLWTLVTGELPAGPASLQSDNTIQPIESICRRCLANNPSIADLINDLRAIETR
jgi:RNA polymerase sigma factor (sigma-70 family)